MKKLLIIIIIIFSFAHSGKAQCDGCSYKFYDSAKKVTVIISEYASKKIMVARYGKIKDTLKITGFEWDKNGLNGYCKAKSKRNNLSYITRGGPPMAVTFNNKIYYPDPVEVK